MKTYAVVESLPLLDFLFKHWKDLNKTQIRQALKHGSVAVNGQVVTLHRHALKSGDVVGRLARGEATAERSRSELGFPILYEDDQMLVVDKPSGLLTMGTETEKVNTAYFRLTAYVRASSPDGRGRIFIVHRLDRDASGLVVFAKNETAKLTLQRKWDQAVKKYYAIVEGVPVAKEGSLESWLAEDKFARVYRSGRGAAGAKPAVTHYRWVRDNGRYALLEVTLETGRKNQVRVQLADEGYPIAGDMKYGAQTDPARRLALHAFWLKIPHPQTGQMMTFHSALPKPLEKLVPISRR